MGSRSPGARSALTRKLLIGRDLTVVWKGGKPNCLLDQLKFETDKTRDYVTVFKRDRAVLSKVYENAMEVSNAKTAKEKSATPVTLTVGGATRRGISGE